MRFAAKSLLIPAGWTTQQEFRLPHRRRGRAFTKFPDTSRIEVPFATFAAGNERTSGLKNRTNCQNIQEPSCQHLVNSYAR
jgi:hypothetical protein